MSDEVPNRILLNKFQAYGCRLPKMKKYEAPRQTTFMPEWEKRRHRGTHEISPGIAIVSSYGRIRQPQNQVDIGNLDIAEYRYWIGVRNKLSLAASCRLCKWPTWNGLQRKEHKQFGCLAALDDLYKILWNDEVCLMCGKPSKMCRWGVRFCTPGSECLAVFPFSYESQRLLAIEFMGQFKDDKQYASTKLQVEFSTKRQPVPDVGAGSLWRGLLT